MNASDQTQRTICAPATPAGGAIAVIRISGPGAIAIADSVFHGRARLSEAKTHTAHFGTIQNTSQPSEVVDEVVATVFRSPHSYTGEDSVELSCHGSHYIQNAILELLQQQGCAMASPGEFTQRAFMNGRIDLSQAEAVADLIAAESRNSHHVALAQLRGGVSNRLKELREQLLTITALLELELDFSDHEDLEFADRGQLIDLATATLEYMQQLADTFRHGEAFRLGIPVAIVGKTNVGKSTLLNALVGDNRAIVSDIHGTTRDTIEDVITINGQAFRIIDTAGLRDTDDTVERLGIERSLQKIVSAQIVVWVTDAPPTPDEEHDMQARCAGKQLITVRNKADLIPADPLPQTDLIHKISAATGQGIDALRTAIYTAAALPQVSHDTIITNARHHQALLLAIDDIRRALQALEAGISADLVSEDLRLCIAHLADITGQSITPQDTLNTIFSRFCVGK